MCKRDVGWVGGMWWNMRRQCSWLDLATVRRHATGQLLSTLAEHGGSCLATVAVELYRARGGGEERGWGGDDGGGSSSGGAGGGGALRDQSLQQYITTQLPTPPTIHCLRCLATPPPFIKKIHPPPLSLKMPKQWSRAGTHSPLQTGTGLEMLLVKTYSPTDWQF